MSCALNAETEDLKQNKVPEPFHLILGISDYVLAQSFERIRVLVFKPFLRSEASFNPGFNSWVPSMGKREESVIPIEDNHSPGSWSALLGLTAQSLKGFGFRV